MRPAKEQALPLVWPAPSRQDPQPLQFRQRGGLGMRHSPKVSRWVIAVVLAGAPGAPARAADETSPGPRRELRDVLGASVNLPGLQNSLELSWRWDKAAVGLTHVLAPTYTRLGLWAEVVPVPAFAARAGIEPAGYFGIGTALLAFEGYGGDFSKGARDARGGEKAGFGGRAHLSTSLRLRVGPVLASSTAELEWWRYGGEGPFYYEPARDALLEAKGDRLWTLTSTVLLERAWPDGRKLSLGANHRLLRVPAARGNDVQKLGGVFTWTLGERRLGVRQPTLLANVGVYLDDRFKDGEAFGTLAARFVIGR